MRSIDRIRLIEKIARKLQETFTFADIYVFLKNFGIDKSYNDYGSRRLYVKDALNDTSVSEDVVLRIAEEIEVECPPVNSLEAAADSRFWITGHFKLFLSHLSSFKATTALLQNELKKYGVSCFVAHNDISPTSEWQKEIEKALFSMDALVAILMPGFRESLWTDQETGIAIGRDVLVIPLDKGLVPYGFISKYQALQTKAKNVEEVADAIFRILLEHPKTNDKMLSCLVGLFLSAQSEQIALDRINLIKRVAVPIKHLEKIKEGYTNNSTLRDSTTILSKTNNLLKTGNIGPIVLTPDEHITTPWDDDIPF